MSGQRPIERVLDDWLAEGPDVIADRVVADALSIVDQTAQHRATRVPRRLFGEHTKQWFGIAAALVLAVGAGMFFGAFLRPGQSGVGQSLPSPTPAGSSPTAVVPSPAGSNRSASPRPSGSVIGAMDRMVPGMVYQISWFTPQATITGAANWALQEAGIQGAFFSGGPNEPNPPDDFGFGILRPTQVLPAGGGSAQALPSDLIAWLEARPDLALTSPTSIQVGGFAGRMVHGTPRPTATFNAEGVLNLICYVSTGCAQETGGGIGFGPDDHFEIIELNVRGQTVVVEMSTHAATWTRDHHLLDALLATLTFPAPGP